MSNFAFAARDKDTGNVVRVYALDDYYGRHEYGYRPADRDAVLDEDEFYQQFDALTEDL